ncbi:uncharacterized protein G2W53_011804 [Senna tora]|uniref:Uncharacterized protein n=1 Tax=Senna tora TaxID=362788 RepID=A0A834TZL5_9FABA|nr:uncharacterized protein G2W53_011804 [Senna tora]
MTHAKELELGENMEMRAYSRENEKGQTKEEAIAICKRCVEQQEREG